MGNFLDLQGLQTVIDKMTDRYGDLNNLNMLITADKSSSAASYLSVQYNPSDFNISINTITPKGFEGHQGFYGYSGHQGPQGWQGPDGNRGPTGVQGPQGWQGPDGNIGPQGFTGIQGPQGWQGPDGNRGPTGVQGPQGWQGWQGPDGNIGPQGFIEVQGPQGWQGPDGNRGLTGVQGPQGWRGLSGDRGPQGLQGNKGLKISYSLSINADKRFILGYSNTTSQPLISGYTNTSIYGQNGELYAATLSTYSDERLKNIVKDVEIDFETLKLIPKKYFTWKEINNSLGYDDKIHIGTNAQDLQKIYPELVTSDEYSNLYVNYDGLNIITLKAIDLLHEKQEEINNRIDRILSRLSK